MTQQIVNTGTTPNDKTGDSIRAAFIKVNNNFNEVYSVLNVNDNLRISGSSLISVNTNGNIIIDPNGTGNTRINSNATVYGNLAVSGGDFSVSGNSVTGGNGNINGNSAVGGRLTVTGNANVANIGAANAVFTGTLSVTGNANVGNLGTAGLITATGNVSGGNLTTAGVVSATGNVSGGNLTTVGQVSATGNVTGGNLTTAGVISATGNVSGGNLTTVGVVSATGNVSGGNLTTAGRLSVTGNANVGNIGATAGVFTGAVSITGNANVGNLNAGNITITGDTISSSNATITIDPATSGVGGTVVIAGNLQVTGTTTTVNSTTVEVTDLNLTLAKDAGTAAAANGAGITVGGASANIYYSSGDDRWNFNKTINANFAGNGSALTNIPGANITGTISSGALPSITNSLLANSSITVNGTTISLGGSGNIALSSLSDVTITSPTNRQTLVYNTSTSKWVNGSGTATTVSSTAPSSPVEGDLWYDTNTALMLIRIGSAWVDTSGGGSGGGSGGNLSAISATGNGISYDANTYTISSNATTANTANTTVFRDASGNFSAGTITATFSGSGSALSSLPAGNLTGTIASGVQGNITAVGTLTSLTVSGAIKPTANATIDIGDSSHYFGTIYGLSTSAKYADVAEIYLNDEEVYSVGTVVIFGGDNEITATDVRADHRVAGVISDNPALLMNQGADGQPVALRGRVMINIVGPVAKGDLLITSSTRGYAESVGGDLTLGAAVFAKSLNDDSGTDPRQIEGVIL